VSREKLEQAQRKWEEKLAHYEYELSITASAENKFELRERIQQCEQEITRIKNKLMSFQQENVQTRTKNAMLQSSSNQVSSEHPISIFISYSHYDRQYLENGRNGEETEFVRRIIRPLEREGAEFWWDRGLIAGDIFDEEIRLKLENCDILLALISDDFLNSTYCTEVEVASILNRRRNGANVRIVPFYLSPCEWRRVSWLREIHGLPSPNLTMAQIIAVDQRTKEFLRLRENLRTIMSRIRSHGEDQ
jgi:hypothetical protein